MVHLIAGIALLVVAKILGWLFAKKATITVIKGIPFLAQGNPWSVVALMWGTIAFIVGGTWLIIKGIFNLVFPEPEEDKPELTPGEQAIVTKIVQEPRAKSS